MKIVVTGGTGFVGSAVARLLADGGHDVVATFRSSPNGSVRRHLTPVAGTIRLRHADIVNQDRMAGLFAEERPDVVVHAAVQTSIPPEDERAQPQGIIKTNVIGTANVMAAAGRYVSRAIYVSSSAVYPPGQVSAPPLREGDAPGPTRLYGITKYASEMVWRRIAELADVPVAVARIVAPYGPLESATGSRNVMSALHEWVAAARAERPLRVPTWPASKDWTYVVDTARAIALLATGPRLAHDIYHVGCGRLWTVEEVVASVRRHRPGLRVEDVADPSQINPAVSPFGLKPMLSIDRIREDLGFEPTYDLDRGITAYFAWLDQEASRRTAHKGGA